MITSVGEINKEYAVVHLPNGDVRIMHESIDPITGYVQISFMTQHDFNLLFANKQIMTKKDGKDSSPENASKVWRESSNRREYKGVIFAPNKSIDGYYNLFSGFSVNPKKGSWEKFSSVPKTV